MYYGERLNSITHLIGAVLALVGFGALLTISIQSQQPLMVLGFVVFGLSLIQLYTMSTLYHSLPFPRVKRIFQKLDHVSIYLLIAGTYTDRKSTRLNSSHVAISYAVFCLKKKKADDLRAHLFIAAGGVMMVTVGDVVR